ncbi:hypothetical protein [Clostridium gasigenes]|uniref:Uncharacterized protein n=1 Tax=Clostridium gasigenes TaxID=94869 RepID=A0A1H0N6K8_9CLOT|nr:hypothetical protein [Clostridium gasigenes]SDO88369.1 hypothetical protein SAMN04488529_101713 [Clostridium gasigenes]
MLKINKNITLNGVSEIGGVQVVYMSAAISTDGNSNANINKSISNQELYKANKVECRKDMDAFDTEVYEVEDQISKEMEEAAAVTKGGIKNEIN